MAFLPVAIFNCPKSPKILVAGVVTFMLSLSYRQYSLRRTDTILPESTPLDKGVDGWYTMDKSIWLATEGGKMARKEIPQEFCVKEDLLFAVVCSSLPQEEVERRMKDRPCGTTNGWLLAKSKKSGPNPSPCIEYPETNKHYLFEC